MIAEVRFKFGNNEYKLSFDDKLEVDALHKMIALSNPPRFCDVCQNRSYFTLETNKHEANTFINVKCTAQGCWAKSKLGQYKSGGYFWHKFEKYIKETETEAIDSV